MSLTDNFPAGHVNLSKVGTAAMRLERLVRLPPPRVRRVAYALDEERWDITVIRNHAPRFRERINIQGSSSR